MNIKKKLLALSLVCAMAASFSACTDTGTSDKDNSDDVVTEETLSSEEIQQLEKNELTITPYEPEGNDESQDPVEGEDSADNGDNSNAQQSGNSSDSGEAGENSVSETLSEQDLLDPTDVVIIPGNSNDDSSEGDNNGGSSSVISGKKTVMQAWWMDLSQREDIVFNGEYIVAEFKIKETTEDGTYPITVEWMDFSNWDATSVKFTGIDGAVYVGSDAPENQFKNNGTPELMVQNASGKAGDTIKVSFCMNNNPGLVATLFRFGYDSNALEYIGGTAGADFEGTFS